MLRGMDHQRKSKKGEEWLATESIEKGIGGVYGSVSDFRKGGFSVFSRGREHLNEEPKCQKQPKNRKRGTGLSGKDLGGNQGFGGRDKFWGKTYRGGRVFNETFCQTRSRRTVPRVRD